MGRRTRRTSTTSWPPPKPKGLKTDLHIIEKLTKKEEEVYKTLGDAGSVMKLYDVEREEKKVQKAIEKGDEGILDTSGLRPGPPSSAAKAMSRRPSSWNIRWTRVSRSTQVRQRSTVISLTSCAPMASVDPGEVEFIDDTYLEVRNTKELNRVLYDLPT